MPVIEGNMNGQGMRFGLIVSRFNSTITDNLLKGAKDTLLRHAVVEDDITTVFVPGSLELGLAAKKLAQTGTVDCVIVLGAVIRGATYHFELVSNGAASAISRIAEDSGIPVIFGVITTENTEQALERSGIKGGNKGADVAAAAIEMVSVMRQLHRRSSPPQKLTAV